MCICAYVHNYKNKMKLIIHVLYLNLCSISSSLGWKRGDFTEEMSMNSDIQIMADAGYS